MCIEYLKANYRMRTLTADQDMKYSFASECCICHKTKRAFDRGDDDWHKNLVFRNTLQHLSSSLEKLPEWLNKVAELKFMQLAHMANFRYARDLAPINHQVLIRKGVFPYEHLTHMDVLAETELPQRDALACRLTGSDIREAYLAHAMNVWKRCVTAHCVTTSSPT